MIKIEINAETGSEARGALLELLGLTGVISANVDFSQLKEQTVSALKIPMEILPGSAEPEPANTAEQPKAKRRTKAEIEAEKEVKAPEETKPAEETKEETTDATTVTVDDLKKKAVELGRVGKRELCRAVLQKFDAESISTPDKTPLKPEHYAAVLDEFNKL